MWWRCVCVRNLNHKSEGADTRLTHFQTAPQVRRHPGGVSNPARACPDLNPSRPHNKRMKHPGLNSSQRPFPTSRETSDNKRDLRRRAGMRRSSAASSSASTQTPGCCKHSGRSAQTGGQHHRLCLKKAPFTVSNVHLSAD